MSTLVQQRALAIAREVAQRLRSPACPAATLAPDPPSLWRGHAGIAVLHSTLSTGDRSWVPATHEHLTAAVTSGASPATVAGLSAAAVLHRNAHGGYTRLLRQAGDALARLCATRIAAYRQRLAAHGPGLAWADYDVVAGLTGKGRLLLALAGLGDDRCRDALLATLDHLVLLTRPVTVHGHRVPGWWCDPDQYVGAADREAFPRGDFNLGLAHGIAGPLALLAIAHRRGYRVDGMVEAMRRIVDWLLTWTVVDRFGPAWPARVSFDEQVGPALPQLTRAAWCYGTAGVARALQLAGHALGDHELRTTAVSALRAVFSRPWKRANLSGPTLCHGAAGLLQITVRAAELDPDPALTGAAATLAERILDMFDPSTPFGFRHHDRAPVHRRVDQPGLLEGAAGVALALATFAGWPAPPTHDAWDAVLLVS